MTESALTSEQLRTLRNSLPMTAVIKKIADGFTLGIPDFFVAVHGYTTWVEVKYLRKGQTLQSEVKELQATTCVQLWNATRGRTWFLVFDERRGKKNRQTLIYPPAEVFHALSRGADAIPTFFADGFDYGLLTRVIEARHKE